MTAIYDLRNRIEELEATIREEEKMTEKQLQRKYNTDDCKSTIMGYNREELEQLTEELRELEYFDQNEDQPAGLDIAFSSWEEVNGMFI